MGETDSSNEDTESTSVSGSATQSAHSRSSKRKESHKEGSSHKKHKSNSGRPSTSTSSIHDVETNQATDKESQPPRGSINHGVNESMESIVQNSRCKKTDQGNRPQAQYNPVPHEQANSKASKDVYVDIENEDEVTSPPREDQQLKEVQVGEERSASPTWLKERLAKEVIAIEEEPLDDLDSFLNKAQETVEKKKATKMSKITKDSLGS